MSAPLRAGAPTRPFTIKITDAERSAWAAVAGSRPLSDWARRVLNRAALMRARRAAGR